MSFKFIIIIRAGKISGKNHCTNYNGILSLRLVIGWLEVKFGCRSWKLSRHISPIAFPKVLMNSVDNGYMTVMSFSTNNKKKCETANTKHLYDICTMLDQRRRRWADFVQMLYNFFIFAGWAPGFDSTVVMWMYSRNASSLNNMCWTFFHGVYFAGTPESKFPSSEVPKFLSSQVTGTSSSGIPEFPSSRKFKLRSSQNFKLPNFLFLKFK